SHAGDVGPPRGAFRPSPVRVSARDRPARRPTHDRQWVRGVGIPWATAAVARMAQPALADRCTDRAPRARTALREDPREHGMTFVLYRKLLRDIRWPLVGACLLLGLFGGLWVRVTQEVTTQISPLLTLVGQMTAFGPTFFHDLFFNGPGKLIQTFLGGEDVK